MRYINILILIFLCSTSIASAKKFFSYSTTPFTSMTYEDSDGGNFQLRSSSSWSLDYRKGDLERGDPWWWGVGANFVTANQDSGKTQYNVKSTEVLLKGGYARSPFKENPGSYGINPSVFIGLGAIDYYFFKSDESRSYEKTKEADPVNYTPVGIEIPFVIYERSWYWGVGFRYYFNKIKIKYLSKADGSESTATIKNHLNGFITLGGFL